MVDRRHWRNGRHTTPQAKQPESFLQKCFKAIWNDEIAMVPHAIQRRRQMLDSRVLQTRYEECATAVALIYAIEEDPAVNDRFADAFQQDLGREPKHDRLIREVCLFVHGKARQDLAGTDGKALSDAIRRRIAPEQIPGYIKAQGGLEKLLKAERARCDPFETIEVSIRRSERERLDALDLGGSCPAKMMRSRLETPTSTEFAIKLK